MGQKRKRKRQQVSKKKRPTGLLLVAGVILGVAIIFGLVSMQSGDADRGKSFYVKGGETRPVLEPARFTGIVRAAYAAAKRYPQVLDQVYCYCYCDQPPFNHKSLLSCFVETHGAG